VDRGVVAMTIHPIENPIPATIHLAASATECFTAPPLRQRTRADAIPRLRGGGPSVQLMVAMGVFVGLATLDVIHHVDAAPAANEKVTARAHSVVAGGPATNAAVTFAALGGTAVLVTALGAGAAADKVRADLARYGVRVVDGTAHAVDQVPISSITVVSSTGERSVVSSDATNITIAEVPDLSEVIRSADIVMVDGHHPALVGAAARAAERASILLVLDAGRWRPVMRELIPRAGAVICSADFRWPGTIDVHSSAHTVVDQGVPTVIVTRGAEAVLWWHAGMSGTVDPPLVDAVDTAGAGDVFHGAYCYYAATTGGPNVARLIAGAAEIAALSCRFPGTRGWLEHLPAR
jgi:sugar/nucleoside kinase (ribokinase family)